MHYLLCTLLLSFINIVMWDKFDPTDTEGKINEYNGVSLMKALDVVKKYAEPLEDIIMELFDLKYPSTLDNQYLK